MKVEVTIMRNMTYDEFKKTYMSPKKVKAFKLEGYRFSFRPKSFSYDAPLLPLEYFLVFDLCNSITYAFLTDTYKTEELEETIPTNKVGYVFTWHGIIDDYPEIYHTKKLETLYENMYKKVFPHQQQKEEENKDTVITMEELERICDGKDKDKENDKPFNRYDFIYLSKPVR